MSRRKKPLPKEPQQAQIVDLTHNGQGVARIEGKTVFIDSALPGESVEFIYTRRKRQYDEGRLHRVLEPAADRVTAKCSHFAVCGGCSLQHLSHTSQIKLKQKVLLDNLQRIGHVPVPHIREPLTGPQWGYRRKARLGVKHVYKKGKVLVGFRESASRYLADLSRCETLVPEVGGNLPALSALVASLSCADAIPQIEVAFGDQGRALVFRHLQPLSESDRDKLIDFAREYEFDIYLQSKGPESIVPLWPEQPVLSYRLANQDLEYQFLPTDFVQVNAQINASIVDMVLELLRPSQDEHILELFCGLGNFTLPIARCSKSLVAVEGERTLIERAKDNANRNGIDNVTYFTANLLEDVADLPFWRLHHYASVFLDPPRSGAELVVHQIGRMGIKLIVYVSCNPATLARDAGILVNEYGYQLLTTGIMDMFPQTAHVESIAVFEKT